MKANELYAEIRRGLHASYNPDTGHEDHDFVTLPKQLVLDMLKELHGRRKRDSKPRNKNEF
jgi:hypothetical protein